MLLTGANQMENFKAYQKANEGNNWAYVNLYRFGAYYTTETFIGPCALQQANVWGKAISDLINYGTFVNVNDIPRTYYEKVNKLNPVKGL